MVNRFRSVKCSLTDYQRRRRTMPRLGGVKLAFNTPGVGSPFPSGTAWLLPILLAAWVLVLPGCGGDPGAGPLEVRWDRYTCERCRMVLSDRKHSAQIRRPTETGRSKTVFFDDIGCALIWLDDQPFAQDPAVEIWVNHWRTGDWIDARTATYLKGQVTPMEYGLGAQDEADPEGLSLAEAKAHVLEVERRFNSHSAHQEM